MDAEALQKSTSVSSSCIPRNLSTSWLAIVEPTTCLFVVCVGEAAARAERACGRGVGLRVLGGSDSGPSSTFDYIAGESAVSGWR